MLFYIDVTDADRFMRDEDGLEFSDLKDACEAAVALLPELAREALHGPTRLSAMMQSRERHIAAQVRDEAGKIHFRTRLRLDMEWPAPRGS
ncbi:DUF6894 family protein [Methylorubrum sp. DB1722]|uniref:DUF6894 family protein n=1 Tax=Methylorubrum sp. DB1722 TaxID=2478916 RepID=UPI0018E37A6F|nr:hypothetical protein [Methylorubrum sp. DB1722]MBI1692054.1 hypothetical protein [Methylorubrum sp. DB1722]